MQVIDRREGLLAKADDNVALAQSSLFCCAVGFNRRNHDASVDRQIVKPDDPAKERNVLSRHADVAATNLAVADKARSDELRRVDGDGKAQPLGGQNHRGVDADHFAVRSHQRPARVAWIQCRVGLDHVVDQSPRTRAQGTPESAHDTRCYGTLKSKGITYCHGELADTY